MARAATKRNPRLDGRRFPGGAKAERAGFEPATHLSAGTRFPVALLRPLGHLSATRQRSASGEGDRPRGRIRPHAADPGDRPRDGAPELAHGGGGAAPAPPPPPPSSPPG